MCIVFHLKITGTFDLTNVHIQALKQNCIEHVEYHQPIPEEIIQSATEPLSEEWFNETEEATTTAAPGASSTGSVAPETSFFTIESLSNLRDIGCPFDCYGNGACHEGNYRHLSISSWLYLALFVSACLPACLPAGRPVYPLVR